MSLQSAKNLLQGIANRSKDRNASYQCNDQTKQRAIDEAIVPYFDLFGAIKPSHLNDLSVEHLKILETQAARANDLLQNLQSGINDSSLMSLLETLKNTFPDTYANLVPILPYSLCRNDSQADLTLKLNELQESFRIMREEAQRTHATQLAEAKKQHDEHVAEQKRLIENLTDASLNRAVSQQSQHFADEVTRHNTGAIVWLAISFVMVLGLLGAAFASLFLHKWVEAKDTYGIIQVAISKVVFLSLLTYVTVQCLKNYYAHRHLKEVNKHRLNAIQSYQHFLDASGDLQVKSTIVSYVAAAVFTPQDTGLVNSTVTFEAPKNLPEVALKVLGGAGGTH